MHKYRLSVLILLITGIILTGCGVTSKSDDGGDDGTVGTPVNYLVEATPSYNGNFCLGNYRYNWKDEDGVFHVANYPGATMNWSLPMNVGAAENPVSGDYYYIEIDNNGTEGTLNIYIRNAYGTILDIDHAGPLSSAKAEYTHTN